MITAVVVGAVVGLVLGIVAIVATQALRARRRRAELTRVDVNAMCRCCRNWYDPAKDDVIQWTVTLNDSGLVTGALCSVCCQGNHPGGGSSWAEEVHPAALRYSRDARFRGRLR